jgi:hypothetical protein
MGIFADRMAELDIQLSSPDGNIHARLSAGDRFEVWFREGNYYRYTESSLEQQLISLARLLFVARRRARLSALSEAVGYRVQPGNSQPDDPRQRRFHEEQSQLVAVGRTAVIEVYGSPGEFWTIRIEPGTLAQLDEAGFLIELRAAVSQAMTDMRQQLLRLREDMYGQRLPAWRGGEDEEWK